MFAARDQENLVSAHQAAASTKQQATTRGLQPKTPGARYPKTPLKIPLNDENAVRGLGGAKAVLGNKTRADQSQWVTPAEPRTGRAVLGDKTTNARARNAQATNGKNGVVRDAEKSQARPTTVSRPKPHAPKSESSKLQILLDQSDPLSGEVDINPPPPPARPYESDVFPAGVLTFDAIRPENRLKGYYDYYHNRRDENGMTRVDREMRAAQEQRFKEADARIRKDVDEFGWDLGLDSPKKKIAPLQEPAVKRIVRPGAAANAPSTLTSRRAASALGMVSKPSLANLQRKPLSAKPTTATNAGRLPSFMQPTKARHTSTNPNPSATTLAIPRTRATSSTAATNAALATSRSTLGYNKGRSASSALHSRTMSRFEAPLAPTSSTAATVFNRSVTPTRPEFVSIFDAPPDEDQAVDAEAESDERIFGSEDGSLLDAGEDDGFQLELGL